MGNKMGKIKVDERGRITLPGDIREELGLKPGTEVNIQKSGKGIIIKPQVTKEDLIEGLKGCITEKNQAQKIDPLELKNIWGMAHAHD